MDTYEIRSVKDFLAIPPDKRTAALADFAMWLAICDTVAEKYTPEELTVRDVFRWKDDGIAGCSEINIITPEQPA
jgi:hypothetical protein